MNRIVAGACIALACFGARAADTGELWEVTTKMDMAGLPAGMGNQTTRVCAERGDPKNAQQGAMRKDCKMTDYKQSGNHVTLTMTCPDGTAVIENVYNAARTEYQGSMKMTMRDGNKMTMNMTGRKVGACDVAQAKRERDEKNATAKRGRAEAQAAIAANEKMQVDNCAKAPAAMSLGLLGVYGQCTAMAGGCEAMLKNESTRATATACMANRADLCKRYQTPAGFLKANGSEDIARECRLSRPAIIASHCPGAAKSENLAYLGRFCPAEAKTLAQQHCAGRSYTSAPRDKYSDFCSRYLADASVDSESASAAPRPAAAKPQPQDAVKQGVTQGINKLKGLFGR
jgi:hypothetical protein